MTVGELIENLQRRYTDDTPIAYMIWDGYDVEDHLDMVYEADGMYPPELTMQVVTEITSAALERLHEFGFTSEDADLEEQTGKYLHECIKRELQERGIPMPEEERMGDE